MNMQEGDSERDRPRRLTEHRMAPRAAGRRLGAALTPTYNWLEGWVVKREGWGSPQNHIKFRVFTQGLCCLSGSQKPTEQVPFPLDGGNRVGSLLVGL